MFSKLVIRVSWSDPVDVLRAMSADSEELRLAVAEFNSTSVVKVSFSEAEKLSRVVTLVEKDEEAGVNAPDISEAICAELERAPKNIPE